MPASFQDGVREVAFLGRSTWGSLADQTSCVEERRWRRPSLRAGNPGERRARLNYYLINRSSTLLTLPATIREVPEQVKSSWGKLIEQYLKGATSSPGGPAGGRQARTNGA